MARATAYLVFLIPVLVTVPAAAYILIAINQPEMVSLPDVPNLSDTAGDGSVGPAMPPSETAVQSAPEQTPSTDSTPSESAPQGTSEVPAGSSEGTPSGQSENLTSQSIDEFVFSQKLDASAIEVIL